MPKNVTDNENTPQQSPPWTLGRVLFAILVAGGILAHLGVATVAGNNLSSPWTGGGDTREYVLLARNLLAGDGYTYAHQPTAFRAPLYPMFLAALMRLTPNYWPIAVHALQFFMSLLLAFFCMRLASRWFGAEAGRVASVFALWLPTFVYFTGEILTECSADLLTILFLLYLDQGARSSQTSGLILIGVFAGLAALERFNSAALAIVAFAVAFAWLPGAPAEAHAGEFRSWVLQPERWRRLLIVSITCAAVVSPWLLHTAMAFHGRALYSTHGGFAAVEGVLMPLGRTQPGETPAIENALGWGNWDVESNDAKRLSLGAEPDLNKQAWHVAFGLWQQRPLDLIQITAKKVGAFWLSTDQAFYTHSFSWKNRVARWAGVTIYWIVLFLAIVGWLRLHGSQPAIAYMLLLFVVFLTVLHLPLTMNTRLRSPLFDPMLTSLAGGGWVSLTARLRGI